MQGGEQDAGHLAGIVNFEHRGDNHGDELVALRERAALMHRRP